MNDNFAGTDYASYTNINASYCGSRLPCGLCLITNKPCPMMGSAYESWTVNTDTATTAK